MDRLISQYGEKRVVIIGFIFLLFRSHCEIYHHQHSMFACFCAHCPYVEAIYLSRSGSLSLILSLSLSLPHQSCTMSAMMDFVFAVCMSKVCLYASTMLRNYSMAVDDITKMA